MPRLLITLCTYNECENLPKLIPDIHAVAPDADVLVIDDNSPDGTGRLADELAAQDSRIKVLHRSGKRESEPPKHKRRKPRLASGALFGPLGIPFSDQATRAPSSTRCSARARSPARRP